MEQNKKVLIIQKHIKYWYDNSKDILINNEGLKMTVDNYRRRYYYKILEQAGIRKLTPHSTRHTFASLMARAGVDTLSIQKIIGHSDYATTANIYTHININELKMSTFSLRMTEPGFLSRIKTFTHLVI